MVLLAGFLLSPAPPPAAAGSHLRIVAFGDSTTAEAGWAPSIKKVYAERLPSSLAQHDIRARVFNAGLGNTTTREARERLDRDVRRHRPDLVIIQFGINDSWIDADEGKRLPRLTRDEFRENLVFIIRALRRDGAGVLLMTPNPMRWSDPYYIDLFKRTPGLLETDDPRGIDRLLDLYAGDVRDLAAAEGVPLVDVFQAFETYGRIPGQSIDDLLLAGDGIHPNDAGHRLVADLLTGAIVTWMRGRAGGGPPTGGDR